MNPWNHIAGLLQLWSMTAPLGYSSFRNHSMMSALLNNLASLLLEVAWDGRGAVSLWPLRETSTWGTAGMTLEGTLGLGTASSDFASAATTGLVP
uniref:Secreted protein n=1 Tax=Ixodes ricinus TaxID=34613 RepID=A0A6B0U5X4_IXORI